MKGSKKDVKNSDSRIIDRKKAKRKADDICDIGCREVDRGRTDKAKKLFLEALSIYEHVHKYR